MASKCIKAVLNVNRVDEQRVAYEQASGEDGKKHSASAKQKNSEPVRRLNKELSLSMML